MFFVKYENTLIICDIPLCDHKNEMFTKITDMKYVRHRNEDTTRSRVRAKGDGINFLP